MQNAAIYTAAKARLADTQVGMAVYSATSEPMTAKPATPGMPPSLERSSRPLRDHVYGHVYDHRATRLWLWRRRGSDQYVRRGQKVCRAWS